MDSNFQDTSPIKSHILINIYYSHEKVPFLSSKRTDAASYSMRKHAEFKRMVDEIRIVEKALGKVTYCLTEKQEKSREEGRSLFVTADMKKGDVFTPENMRSIRPAFGMAPRYYEEILGKRARCDISRGTPMDWKYVE